MLTIPNDLSIGDKIILKSGLTLPITDVAICEDGTALYSCKNDSMAFSARADSSFIHNFKRMGQK